MRTRGAPSTTPEPSPLVHVTAHARPAASTTDTCTVLADVDAADRAGRAAAENHPERRTARMVAAVLRDGHRITLLMLQPDDDDPFADAELLRADQLAPGLIQGLLATFDED